jgi:hAT family C-terminal dimerisation region
MKIPLMAAMDQIDELLFTQWEFHCIEHTLSIFRQYHGMRIFPPATGIPMLEDLIQQGLDADDDEIKNLICFHCKQKPCSSVDFFAQLYSTVQNLLCKYLPQSSVSNHLENFLLPNKWGPEGSELSSDHVLSLLSEYKFFKNDSAFKAELQKYNSLTYVRFTDPLDWWRENKTNYPTLSKIANSSLVYPSFFEFPSYGDAHTLIGIDAHLHQILFLTFNSNFKGISLEASDL